MTEIVPDYISQLSFEERQEGNRMLDDAFKLGGGVMMVKDHKLSRVDPEVE